MMKFKSSFTGRSSLMAKFMPNTELRAIGLLHDSNTDNASKDFMFSKKQPIVKINSDIQL